MKDRLYLLKPNFIDQGKVYFCPGCAQVEGMLSFQETKASEAKGNRFISGPIEICRYLAAAYGVGEPH